MSTGYKISEQDELHYVTFQVVRWIDIFTRQIYRDIVMDSLRFCQQHKGLEIDAFVIMSNHIHLLLRSEKAKLSNTIQSRHCKEKKIIFIPVQETMPDWMVY
jgi:REP element-mobilizing transposase RayT